MKDEERIRNFSIIAHIDHGKSTLADRLLEHTNILNERDKQDQILDNMDIERERGITIKSQTVCMEYKSEGETYKLNLIDTPGHVDFAYEVSRALLACEGVLLVIDASQGVEAQTLANLYMAMEYDLVVIPIINKIDLPTANIGEVRLQIEKELGLSLEMVVEISAKEGINIDKVLKNIVKYCPSPKGHIDKEESKKVSKALLFDAYFDYFRGVVMSVRVFAGEFKAGDTILFMQSGKENKVEEVGIHRLGNVKREKLYFGEVGYIISNIKTLSDTKIGDTLTLKEVRAKVSLPGYKEIKPMVYAGLYPLDSRDYETMKDAIEKLKLNDASLIYEPESSKALGFGYRCGFLGLLHMEIVIERFNKEFNLGLLTTSPSVEYRVIYTNGKEESISNPTHFPDRQYINAVKEPYILSHIICPEEYLGNIINLCHERRGIQKNLTYVDGKRVEIEFELPLAEVVYDFHDKLKSLSRGYASYDYNLFGYKSSELTRVDIMINHKRVDAFSHIIHKDKAQARGRTIVEKLKELIPKQMFQIPIQAAIGSNIIARENIRALRKDVTSKCYGGDISRKRKLLEKQKEGKKKMKQIGNVDIPQDAFLSVLRV